MELCNASSATNCQTERLTTFCELLDQYVTHICIQVLTGENCIKLFNVGYKAPLRGVTAGEWQHSIWPKNTPSKQTLKHEFELEQRMLCLFVVTATANRARARSFRAQLGARWRRMEAKMWPKHKKNGLFALRKTYYSTIICSLEQSTGMFDFSQLF